MKIIKHVAIVLVVVNVGALAYIYQSNSSNKLSVEKTSLYHDVITEQPLSIKKTNTPSQSKSLQTEVDNKKTILTRVNTPPQKRSSQPFDSRAPQAQHQKNSPARLHGHENSSHGLAPPRPPGEPTKPSREPQSGH